MERENLFFKSSLRCFLALLLILCVFTAPGQFVTVTEVYAQTGTLHVVISPHGAIDDGAQWRVNGGAWPDSGGYVALDPGTYTVDFKVVTGWHTPPNETVTITDGQITEVTGTYTRVRDLKITLSPQGAVDDGAKWNVDGGGWQDSGATVLGLSVGVHTV